MTKAMEKRRRSSHCLKVVESQADVGDDFSEFIREKKKRRKKKPNVGLRDNLFAYINAARQECVLVYCVCTQLTERHLKVEPKTVGTKTTHDEYHETLTADCFRLIFLLFFCTRALISSFIFVFFGMETVRAPRQRRSMCAECVSISTKTFVFKRRNNVKLFTKFKIEINDDQERERVRENVGIAMHLGYQKKYLTQTHSQTNCVFVIRLWFRCVYVPSATNSIHAAASVARPPKVMRIFLLIYKVSAINGGMVRAMALHTHTTGVKTKEKSQTWHTDRQTDRRSTSERKWNREGTELDNSTYFVVLRYVCVLWLVRSRTDGLSMMRAFSTSSSSSSSTSSSCASSIQATSVAVATQFFEDEKFRDSCWAHMLTRAHM